MTPWWAVPLIAWAGGMVGFLTCSLLVAAARGDRWADLWSTPDEALPSEGGETAGDPP